MEIRAFNGKDVRVISGLIVKNIGPIMQITAQPKPADITEEEHHKLVAAQILPLMAGEANQVIWDRLADLAGMTLQQADEADACVWLDIIDAIIARGEYKDFFGRCRQYAGLMSSTV